MLNISKKFLSVLLIVIMVCSLFTIVPFSVSAYANIDGYPDFDVDIYVAGLMTDSDNPLYSTIDNQISLDSPNDVVIKQLKEDTGFQASYAAWQIATFKGGDTVSDPLTEVGYYQSLILNTISEALTSSNVKNAFDNTVIKDAKHLQSTFTNILKLEFVFTDLNDLNVAEMSQDEQIKVMDAFSSSFKKTYPAVSDVGKFVSVFSTIVKEGKALETAINNLVAYTESVGMTNYMKAVVSDLYKNCDSSNVAMKSALFEIDKACQSYELAYSAATFDAAISSLSVVCEKVVNTMVDGIVAANPVGLSIMIGQAIGKGVANFLFSTDAICEQYHKMCCLYEFEELLGKVTKLEMDSFSNSKTNYNANKIFSAVDFLYKEYDVSCDLAKKYADIIFKESIAGVFVLNGDGYNKYISSVESLRSIAESNYEFLKGDAWMCFLEEDYPDIYNALIKEDEEINNPYIPVTKIAFEKESVEWGTQDTFLNYDKATITPINASSKGIEYTSSDPSVVSYNKFGAVVHKAGKATVTATSVSSGLTATLNVTVVDGKGADGIAVEDPDLDNQTVKNGEIFTLGNNKYKVLNSKTVGVVSGAPNDSGVVTIPETVSYKNKLFTVTSVIDGSIKAAGAAQGAFTNGGSYFNKNTSVKKIILPNTVTYVGRFAFCYCRNLKSVDFPEGVVSLGMALFDYSGVKTVTIPQSLKSLGGCGASSSTFENGGFLVRTVYYYGSQDNWDNLSDASGSYYGLKDVAEVYILHTHRYSSEITKKPTYTETGVRTFMCICGDSYTETVDKLPIEILYSGKCGEEIHWSLNVLGLLSISGTGDMYDYTSSDVPWDTICDKIKAIEIADGVTSIGGYAFYYCTSLANVTIPNSVKSIGDDAFKGCRNLASVTIPDSVTSIGESAFSYCTSLASVTIPNSVKSIGDDAFYYCTSLASVTIPDSVTSISWWAFSYCTSLTNVTIPDSVTWIVGYAFYNCTSLKNVTIPNSITYIGGAAFKDCTSLTDVYYSGSEKEWNKISIGTDNSYLKYATIHFSSEDPLPAETIVDENTGISVTTNSAAEINVEILTDSDSVKNVISLLDKSEKLADLYDISLTKGGVSVQPDEPATVKIPTDNENAKVYRIEDNGTTTDMNAVYDNGYMVFTTEHFSLYALVVPNDNVVIGDVNSDGSVTVQDATVLQKYLAGLVTLSDEQLAVADTNGDGSVTVADATAIQKYLANLVTSLG